MALQRELAAGRKHAEAELGRTLATRDAEIAALRAAHASEVAALRAALATAGVQLESAATEAAEAVVQATRGRAGVGGGPSRTSGRTVGAAGARGVSHRAALPTEWGAAGVGGGGGGATAAGATATGRPAAADEKSLVAAAAAADAAVDAAVPMTTAPARRAFSPFSGATGLTTGGDDLRRLAHAHAHHALTASAAVRATLASGAAAPATASRRKSEVAAGNSALAAELTPASGGAHQHQLQPASPSLFTSPPAPDYAASPATASSPASGLPFSVLTPPPATDNHADADDDDDILTTPSPSPAAGGTGLYGRGSATLSDAAATPVASMNFGSPITFPTESPQQRPAHTAASAAADAAATSAHANIVADARRASPATDPDAHAEGAAADQGFMTISLAAFNQPAAVGVPPPQLLRCTICDGLFPPDELAAHAAACFAGKRGAAGKSARASPARVTLPRSPASAAASGPHVADAAAAHQLSSAASGPAVAVVDQPHASSWFGRLGRPRVPRAK